MVVGEVGEALASSPTQTRLKLPIRVGMTAVEHAAHEESVVRVKDLKDLVLPPPPENAGQARGFVNQVLMAIGRLQKTPRDEVYQCAAGQPAATL